MARHYAACTHSGRVKKRAAAPEQALARVCREAGAVVKCNVFLRDLNVGVSAADGRRLEVLAQGLPCRGGRQLAVDVTLRSVLRADGTPQPRAATVDGIVATRARQDKEEAYPGLVAARRCALVVVVAAGATSALSSQRSLPTHALELHCQHCAVLQPFLCSSSRTHAHVRHRPPSYARALARRVLAAHDQATSMAGYAPGIGASPRRSAPSVAVGTQPVWRGAAA
jgi:hypothetical protein